MRGSVADPCTPPELQQVERLVRSASGSPLLLRKSLNANESQISLMGRVPPYLGRGQVPRYRASQPAKLSPSQPAHHTQAATARAGSQKPGTPGNSSLSCSSCPVLPCPARPCPILSTPLHWTGLGLASFGVGDWSPFQNRPCRRRFVLSSPNSTGASLDKASTCNVAGPYRPSPPRQPSQTSLNSLESSPRSRHLSLSAIATAFSRPR